ncbi:MAG: PAS domain S-box protein [Thermodesulfobacteriota bacterium]
MDEVNRPTCERMGERDRALDLAATESIRQARQRAHSLIEQSPLAFLLVSDEGLAEQVNRQWEELWGGSGGQVVGRFNILAEKQFREMGVDHSFRRAMAGENVLFPDMEFDAAAAGCGSQRRWVRTHLFRIEAPEGGRAQVAVAQMDITTCMQCEERYHVLVNNANEAIMVVQDGLLKFFNYKALSIAGYTRKEDYAGKSILEFVHPDHRGLIMDRHRRRCQGEEVPNFYEVKVLHKDGRTIWLQLNAIRIEWEGKPASLAFLYDVSEHKKAEEELASYRNHLEEMVRHRTAELEKALREVRTLKGLIPVCSCCKSIRDDRGYWGAMEEYIRTHSDAQVTHGLCPICAERLYPQLFRSPADYDQYVRACVRDGEPPEENEP